MGYGVMLWPDNTRYEGEFLNGKMEGKGIKTWPNGNRYEGMWKNDMQHGPGIFYSAKTGKEKPEEWREGKRWTWTKATTKGGQGTNSVLGNKSSSQVREEGWVR